MTDKERNEAAAIVNKYKSVNEKLARLLSSIEKINEKKEKTLKELEDIRTRELEFVKSYSEKYGTNIISDLQKEAR